MTLDEAKRLKHGDMLQHTINKNADGTPQRWKVNGMVKTWKRDKGRIRVPVKNGIRYYDYVTEKDLHLVEVVS